MPALEVAPTTSDVFLLWSWTSGLDLRTFYLDSVKVNHQAKCQRSDIIYFNSYCPDTDTRRGLIARLGSLKCSVSRLDIVWFDLGDCDCDLVWFRIWTSCIHLTDLVSWRRDFV